MPHPVLGLPVWLQASRGAGSHHGPPWTNMQDACGRGLTLVTPVGPRRDCFPQHCDGICCPHWMPGCAVGCVDPSCLCNCSICLVWNCRISPNWKIFSLWVECYFTSVLIHVILATDSQIIKIYFCAVGVCVKFKQREANRFAPVSLLNLSQTVKAENRG